MQKEKVLLNKKKMHLFISHQLVCKQVAEIYDKLCCNEIISLPDGIQQLWSHIPADGDISNEMLQPFIEYLGNSTNAGDYVLIQGEFGISFALVSWCLHHQRIAVYATTERKSSEIRQSDGSIKKINVFQHVQFRRYRI